LGLDAPLGDIVPAAVAVAARAREVTVRVVQAQLRADAPPRFDAHRLRRPARALLPCADQRPHADAARRRALVAKATRRDLELVAAERQDVERRPEAGDIAEAGRAPRLGQTGASGRDDEDVAMAGDRADEKAGGRVVLVPVEDE